jgi:DNA-binding NarL/FixJ family response regulator
MRGDFGITRMSQDNLRNVYFTKRQRDVLQAIVDGYTTRQQIADHLGVEPATVRNHLSTIYDKAGVRRIPALLLHLDWLKKSNDDVGERVAGSIEV